jgi:hypothetical protein
VIAAWLAGIVATSLVGSVHCVAMCGPLVGLHGGASSMRLALAHAAGRLTTYVVLGALAGLVGSAVDLAGRVGDVQRAATIVAGVVIVVVAVAGVVRPYLKARAPRRTPSAFATSLVRIRTQRPSRRLWWTGALTGLLPCGWLWAFVISAGGTGSPVLGAAVMLAFWLGTVPAMIGVLAFAGGAIARMRARMPAITAITLLVLGLGTLALRWRDAGETQVVAPHCTHCHGASS